MLQYFGVRVYKLEVGRLRVEVALPMQICQVLFLPWFHQLFDLEVGSHRRLQPRSQASGLQLVDGIKVVRPLDDVEGTASGPVLVLGLTIVVEVHALHELHVLRLLKFVGVEFGVVL